MAVAGVLALALILSSTHAFPCRAAFFSREPGVIDAVTFATEKGKVFVPLEEAARELRWKVSPDGGNASLRVNGVDLPASNFRRFVDGSVLVSIGDLERAGATVERDPAGSPLRVKRGRRSFEVEVGAKRAEISLARQRLRAWQGDRLVLESRVSSGRGGSTPAGNFRAGPYKARMHYSTLYDNAPMPWSVQIHGHIFIHGFTIVPRYPASHGCIRLPLDEGNPAKFFYEWIDRGTPVRVARE